MNSKFRVFLISSICFIIFFLVIDLKNYYTNGASFVVTGDIFDTLKHYLTIPGSIPSFIVILIVYNNIHNYNYIVMESVTLLSSSILYGFVISLFIRNRKKVSNENKSTNSSGGLTSGSS